MVLNEHLGVSDILNCLLVSKAWNRLLCSPDGLRSIVLKCHPREKSELKDLTCAAFLKRLQRILNFQKGGWTCEMHITGIFYRFSEWGFENSPYTAHKFSYSWPKLAFIKSPKTGTSSVEVNTIKEGDQPLIQSYYGHDRETFQHIKCSPTLLVAISSMSKCYVWDHVKNELVDTFKFGPGAIIAIDVSDDAVVMLQDAQRITTWSGVTRKVMRFMGRLPDHKEVEDSEIFLEPGSETFIHFARTLTPDQFSAHRFSLSGGFLAWVTLECDLQEADEHSTSRCVHNTIQRQPQDMYVIWSLVCHDMLAESEHSSLLFIRFNPAIFEFSIDKYDLPWESVLLDDLIIQYGTVYMIWHSVYLRPQMSVLELANGEARPLDKGFKLNSGWQLLIGDERLLLHVYPVGYNARWFDEELRDSKTELADF